MMALARLVAAALAMTSCVLAATTMEDRLTASMVERLKQEIAKDNATHAVEASGFSGIFRYSPVDDRGRQRTVQNTRAMPVVLMHGIGDFAANPLGMVPFKNDISKWLGGVYTTNVQLGDNFIEDILNGYILDLDKSVDDFAAFVQKDANLADGFDAVGFSQGNIIIRGYVEKYNSPPIKRWISVNGPLMGVSSVPRCPTSSFLCRWLTYILGEIAYTSFFQDHLTPADYFRDPLQIPELQAAKIFLADINNEDDKDASISEKYKANFASLEKIVCVKAENDTVVWPKESEWWAQYADGQGIAPENLLSMKDTVQYQNDSFGLQTLDTKGGIVLESAPGDHLQIPVDQLHTLVTTYFT